MNSAPPSTLTDSLAIARESIAAIDHPVLSTYFTTLNAGEFRATTALFAPEGALQPPFEKPIVGATAIESYLEAEAKGLVLYPQQVSAPTLVDGGTELQVGGRVQTALFSVNVGWRFLLNPQQEICFVRVKLLASLEELVRLRG